MGLKLTLLTVNILREKCAAIYSKRDLEKWFNLLSMRTSLKHVMVDKDIAGRYYQEAAIKAVCNSFDEKNRRKALLVMGDRIGKDKNSNCAVSIALLKAGWVKNILFLADRNSLGYAGEEKFCEINLQSLSLYEFSRGKRIITMHIAVFSTYQTMNELH